MVFNGDDLYPNRNVALGKKNASRMSLLTFFDNPGFGAARLRQFLFSQSRFLSATASLVDPLR
jgi:hypothetical protein